MRIHCLLRRLHDRSCLEIKLGVGHWDGLVGKSPCHQSYIECDPQNPSRARRKLISTSCPLQHTGHVVKQPIVSAQCRSGYVVYERRVIAVLPPPLNRAAFSLSWPSRCLLSVSMYYCFLLSPASLLSDLVPICYGLAFQYSSFGWQSSLYRSVEPKLWNA